MWFSTNKVLSQLSVLICIAISFHFTDGKTSIVIRSLVTPSHVNARGGIYAHTYLHGAPLPKYRIHEIGGRSVRDVWKLRARRENSLKNYASRYKTWSPYKEKLRLRDIPLKDPLAKRRRPIGLGLKHADDIFLKRRPGRPYKQLANSLQRPTPPAEIQDDFDTDDYFPEETKRAEAHYEYRDGPRRPFKKRRNPLVRKKKPKKPIPYLKPSYEDDDRRVVFDEDRPDGLRQKPKRQPSVSYSTFIQHPPGDVDYDYPDEEEVRLSNRKKKKRIKKKTNNKHNDDEEVEEYRPESYPEIQRYPSSVYSSGDEDYDIITRNKVKVKKFRPEPQPIYGDGHISHQSTSSVFTSSNLFRSPEDFGHQKVQAYNSIPFSQPISNPSPSAGGYHNYVQPNNIHYNKITQPSHDYSNIYGYNNAGYNHGTYSNAPVTTYESLLPSSTSNYQKFRHYQEQQPSVYYSPSLSYQKDVGTSYRTSPAYDSTDTFKDFSNNASNQKKYATYSSKYSEGSGIIPSVQISERPDHENDFLQKHQNLYNNGISGVPIQGDGYMNKEIKKDYDIGYGEFQFDENPA